MATREQLELRGILMAFLVLVMDIINIIAKKIRIFNKVAEAGTEIGAGAGARATKRDTVEDSKKFT